MSQCVVVNFGQVRLKAECWCISYSLKWLYSLKRIARARERMTNTTTTTTIAQKTTTNESCSNEHVNNQWIVLNQSSIQTHICFEYANFHLDLATGTNRNMTNAPTYLSVTLQHSRPLSHQLVLYLSHAVCVYARNV